MRGNGGVPSNLMTADVPVDTLPHCCIANKESSQLSTSGSHVS